MSLHILQAKQEVISQQDIQEIVQLLRTTWLDTYINEQIGVTREKIEHMYTNNDVRVNNWAKAIEENNWKINGIWIAKDDNEVVGLLRTNSTEEHKEVQALYVAPDQQGKGVGKKLMEEVKIFYAGAPIYLEVASYNDRAKAFYTAQGFTPTGKTGALDMKRDGNVLFTIPLEEMIYRNK